jgi:ABC-type multidrug transport system fused ATPase/permease subunit
MNSLTAFVGASGSGKTTTASILLNLYTSYTGSIHINGKDYRDIKLRSFYENVAYVSQDVTLFDGSFEENIMYGKQGASLADVELASTQANIHEFIMSLPEGYKTIIGDKGIKLSGGQKQRLAIARALVRQPKLLVFDEATSALDSTSERLIQEAIEQVSSKMTIIAIAHRLSTIKNASNIYVFSEGTIAEQGSFKDLIAREGIFHSMVKTQVLAEKMSLKNSSQQRRFTVV